MTKLCLGCKQVKDIGCFTRDSKAKDGFSPRCSACKHWKHERKKGVDLPPN